MVFRRWLPQQAPARWALGLAFGVVATALVALGIRSLSGDFLIRVSGMVRGGPAARSKGAKDPGRVRSSPGCAGDKRPEPGMPMPSRMMLRDWQFRRQLIPAAVFALVPLALALAHHIVKVDKMFTPYFKEKGVK
jgi:hypothetical protein